LLAFLRNFKPAFSDCALLPSKTKVALYIRQVSLPPLISHAISIAIGHLQDFREV
jgi:hypothetical protein